MTKHYKTVGIVGMSSLAVIRELNVDNLTIHDLDRPMIKAEVD